MKLPRSQHKFSLASRGQVLVELALLLPVLLLLILGIIEFGRAFYMKNTLANAVRHAARKAIVSGSWNQSSIRYWTYSAVPPGWQNSNALPQVSSFPASPPMSGSGAAITVQATAKFETTVPNFYFPFINYTTIRAQATMRYEQ